MRWVLPILALMLLVSACGGSEQSQTPRAAETVDQQAVEQEEHETEPADQQARQPAEQKERTEQADQSVAETTTQSEQSALESEQQDASPADHQQVQQQARQQAEATTDAPFDPDAAEMSELVYWAPADGFFGRYLPIPGYGQALIDQLLASDSPAIDKYIIDLAAFPSPYWEQALEYLKARFGNRCARSTTSPGFSIFTPMTARLLLICVSSRRCLQVSSRTWPR